MKRLIKEPNKFRPIITLNSRLIRCEGKQTKVMELLESNDEFVGYGYDLEANEGECIACANTSAGMTMTNVTTNEEMCPPYFVRVNSFLKNHVDDIKEACSCE